MGTLHYWEWIISMQQLLDIYLGTPRYFIAIPYHLEFPDAAQH